MSKKRIHDFQLIVPDGDEILIVDDPDGLGGFNVKGVLVSDLSATIGGNNSNDIVNQSSVPGTNVTEALDALFDQVNWEDLALKTSVPPSLNTTIPSGRVFNYSYSNGTILYRLVPSPYVYNQDIFYSNFDGTNLSGVVAIREFEV